MRFACCLLGLLTAACQPAAPSETVHAPAAAQAALRPVDTAAATAGPRPPLEAPAARVGVPAAPTDTVAAFVMPEPLYDDPIPDSLGPVALPWQEVDLAGFRADSKTELKADTLLDRLVRVTEGGAVPRLFYRPRARHSAWVEVGLPLPGNEDWTFADLDVASADLDQRGAPEVLVTMGNGVYGSGGGSHWTYQCVLDLSATPPLLLLQATVEQEYENFGRDNTQPDGHTRDPNYERYTGWQRTIKLSRGTIEVGPIDSLGRSNEPCTLTRLPAGRYRYQSGRVGRVAQ